MAEAGKPLVLGDSWVGILVPAGPAKEIVTALHREIAHIIAQSDMRERLTALGYEPIASTPSEFSERIKSETSIWARVIQAANIKIQ